MSRNGLKADPMKHKLLIVDDKDNVQQALIRLFEDDEYEIIRAKTGRQALDLLTQHNDVGVIITDQIMPGMTGSEMLKEAQLMCPKAGRILLCGAPDRYRIQNAVNDQVVEHLVKKPWENSVLREIVKSLFEDFHAKS